MHYINSQNDTAEKSFSAFTDFDQGILFLNYKKNIIFFINFTYFF